MRRSDPLWVPEPSSSNPVVARLSALAKLEPGKSGAITDYISAPSCLGARRALIEEGAPLLAPMAMLEGWAASIHTLMDGRRQILHLWLPGDVIGRFGQGKNRNPAGIYALTDVKVARFDALPEPDGASLLHRAITASAAQTEIHLLNQITRLGRQSAYERLASLLLELRDRLSLADCCDNYRCPLPLTQETIADVIGLTAVHLNRTLQALRREGMIELGRGEIEILAPDALARIAEYRPAVLGS